MQTSSQALLPLTVIASLTKAVAGGAALGVVMASGPFQNDDAEVRGNAGLLKDPRSGPSWESERPPGSGSR